MEMEAMKLVMQVPGVKMAVAGIGRGESPADPQAQNESNPIVSLKPRDEWPEGWTQEDIADAIREKLKVLLAGDLLDPQVARALDAGGDPSDRVGGLLQRVQIVAEDLDRDVGAHAGHHLVDPLRDRLGQCDRHARKHLELLADRVGDVLLRPSAWRWRR